MAGAVGRLHRVRDLQCGRGVHRRTRPARRHGPATAREAVLPAAAARGRRGRAGRHPAVAGGGPGPGWPRSASAAPEAALRHLAALTVGVSRRAADPADAAAGAAGLLLLQPRPGRRLAVLPAGVRGTGRHPLVPAAAARRGIGGAAAGHPAGRLPADRQPAHQGARGAAAAGRRRRPARRRNRRPWPPRCWPAAGGRPRPGRPSTWPGRPAGRRCSGWPAATCSA